MTTEFIWLLGGSLMSIPMAREIKRRGYKLLLTDKNEHCACREYADKFYPISVYDERRNLALAQTWKWGKTTNAEMLSGDKFGQIAAVLCIGCDAGPTVSLVSDYLGLPSVGYETAKLVKDKALMRDRLKSLHPHKYSIDESIPFPCVVKARNLAGSRGFHVISNQADLTDLWNSQELKDSFIEEMLEGEDLIPAWRDRYGFDTSEVALDFFVQDGEVFYANGALRLFWTDLPGIEAGHLNPFVPDKEIMKLAQFSAEQFGVKWGPFKLDLKKDKRYGWCILEAATRLSGGYDHGFTCIEATGKNITKVMLDVALGYNLDLDDLQPKRSEFVCAYAPRFEPGEIWGWNMSEKEVEATDHFNVRHCFKTTRKEIKPLSSNQNRPLFIITKGCNSQDEALQSALNAASSIAPIYVA